MALKSYLILSILSYFVLVRLLSISAPSNSGSYRLLQRAASVKVLSWALVSAGRSARWWRFRQASRWACYLAPSPHWSYPMCNGLDHSCGGTKASP
jgi:hypothetical protein